MEDMKMYKFMMKTRPDGQDEASCDGLVAVSRNGASCKLARMIDFVPFAGV